MSRSWSREKRPEEWSPAVTQSKQDTQQFSRVLNEAAHEMKCEDESKNMEFSNKWALIKFLMPQ